MAARARAAHAQRGPQVVDLVKSPANGICFCQVRLGAAAAAARGGWRAHFDRARLRSRTQGTIASGGEDVPAAIRRAGDAIKCAHAWGRGWGRRVN